MQYQGNPKLRVLVTGAAGNIGGVIIARLAERYDWLLTDLRQPADTRGLPFVPVDITDLAALRSLCKEVEVVVHLAAMTNPATPWPDLLQSNIVGAYNLFQAAYEAGCQRVIFASSLHAVGGYPPDMQIKADVRPHPLNLYGASKAWGEAAAAYYAYQLHLSVICLRIGWVLPRDDRRIVPGAPHLNVVITHEDFARLITASINAPDTLRFGIFHGTSNNRWKRLDISNARELLNYEPQDDAFAIAQRNYPAIVRQWGGRVKRAWRSVVNRK